MKHLIRFKDYGNGRNTTVHRRALPTKEEREYRNSLLQNLSRDEENERLRTTKTNAKNRALSSKTEFTHFITFTTDNIELAKDGKQLLNCVQRYLKKQNCNFYIQLECFANENRGFHVHGLTDRNIDFTEWEMQYGFNSEIDVDDENWINQTGYRFRNKNLYCEPIFSDENRCMNYIVKKIDETKARLPKGTHIYKSNTAKSSISSTEMVFDDETNEIEIISENRLAQFKRERQEFLNNLNCDSKFDYLTAERQFLIEQRRAILKLSFNLRLHGRTLPKSERELLRVITSELRIVISQLSVIKVDKNAKNVLNVEATLYHNIYKSNTGHYEYPIPQKNVVKIEKCNKMHQMNNYLLRYVSYVSHIPDT